MKNDRSSVGFPPELWEEPCRPEYRPTPVLEVRLPTPTLSWLPAICAIPIAVVVNGLGYWWLCERTSVALQAALLGTLTNALALAGLWGFWWLIMSDERDPFKKSGGFRELARQRGMELDLRWPHGAPAGLLFLAPLVWFVGLMVVFYCWAFQGAPFDLSQLAELLWLGAWPIVGLLIGVVPMALASWLVCRLVGKEDFTFQTGADGLMYMIVDREGGWL